MTSLQDQQEFESYEAMFLNIRCIVVLRVSVIFIV